jgi:hypothetical protein
MIKLSSTSMTSFAAALRWRNCIWLTVFDRQLLIAIFIRILDVEGMITCWIIN